MGVPAKSIASSPPVLGPKICTFEPVEVTKTGIFGRGKYTIKDAKGNIMLTVLVKFGVPKFVNGSEKNLQEQVLNFQRKWKEFCGAEAKYNLKLTYLRKLDFRLNLDVYLDSSKQPKFKVKGSYFRSSYTIYQADTGALIAKGKRKLSLGRDSYTLKVEPDADYLFVAAVFAIINEFVQPPSKKYI